MQMVVRRTRKKYNKKCWPVDVNQSWPVDLSQVDLLNLNDFATEK